MWVPGALKSQERASDPMAWELQNIVSHCTDADNQTCVLWKNSQGFNHWDIFPAPRRNLSNSQTQEIVLFFH